MEYYLIGIKGAGMSALALILSDLGSKVVGYDDVKKHTFTEDELRRINIDIYSDNTYQYDKNVTVVRSTAIHDEHSEILRAKENGNKIYEYHEMLGILTRKFKTITISGCHGKTTTTSLLSHVVNSYSGCNYLIGDGTGFADKKNDTFILEACEYKRHFLEYNPSIAIITNIDFDHVDYFHDINDVIDAYQTFVNKVEDKIIACGDDDLVRNLKSDKIIYYGTNDNNDIVAKNVIYNTSGMSFDVYIHEYLFGHFELPLYGQHMMLNSLAVIGVCNYLNIPSDSIALFLKDFKGAKRRFTESIIGDIITVDDYAHHPVEVKTTIMAARHKYPDKKIVAIYEPHTFSRTKAFTMELANALNLADYAYVLDIYKARELQEDFPGITSENIIKLLNNGEHIKKDEYNKLINYRNAVIIFMSAGDISDLKEKYEKEVMVANSNTLYKQEFVSD